MVPAGAGRLGGQRWAGRRAWSRRARVWAMGTGVDLGFGCGHRRPRSPSGRGRASGEAKGPGSLCSRCGTAAPGRGGGVGMGAQSTCRCPPAPIPKSRLSVSLPVPAAGLERAARCSHAGGARGGRPLGARVLGRSRLSGAPRPAAASCLSAAAAARLPAARPWSREPAGECGPGRPACGALARGASAGESLRATAPLAAPGSASAARTNGSASGLVSR